MVALSESVGNQDFSVLTAPSTHIKRLPNWRELLLEVKQILEVAKFVRARKFIGIVFLAVSTPALSSSFNFYYTKEQKFNLATMSRLGLAMSVAFFFSVLSVNWFFREKQLKKFYLTTGYLYAFLNLSLLLVFFKVYREWGMEPITLCYILHFLGTYFQELNFLPILNACCRLCPAGLEKSAYAVFTALFNFGFFTASLFAAFLLNFFKVTFKNYSSLWMVILAQALFQVAVLTWNSGYVFPEPYQPYLSSDQSSVEHKEKHFLDSQTSTISECSLEKADSEMEQTSFEDPKERKE